jgi:hypothetical protein
MRAVYALHHQATNDNILWMSDELVNHVKQTLMRSIFKRLCVQTLKRSIFKRLCVQKCWNAAAK